MLDPVNGVEMPNGWEAWFSKRTEGGWCFAMRHKSGDQVSGNQRSEDMARKVAGIIADTTHVEPPKPADPAWIVEVAREGCAATVEGRAPEVAAKYRSGGFDEYPFVRASIATLRLAIERGHVVEAGPIRETLLDGQGDDDGSQILPDFHEGMTLHAMVAACIHLLERRRDALDGYANSEREPRPVKWGAAPAEMARKAVLNAVRPNGDVATFYTAGEPGRIDLEAALKRAWEFGWFAARDALLELSTGTGDPTELYVSPMDRDARSILSTLPAKE